MYGLSFCLNQFTPHTGKAGDESPALPTQVIRSYTHLQGASQIIVYSAS